MPSTSHIISYGILLLIAGGGVYYFSQTTPMDQYSSQSTTEPIIEPTITPASTTTPTPEIIPTGPTVTLKTNKGDIVIEMFADKMPITTGNFMKLAKKGFYNKVKFHRVLKGFMIQAGDPNTIGDNTSTYGQGGPGYTIEDEFVAGLSNVRGTISMANTGQKNSGGSQFFINLVDNTPLDFDKPPFTSSHPVFGRVITGMDVVDAIADSSVMPGGLPVSSVVIESVEVK